MLVHGAARLCTGRIVRQQVEIDVRLRRDAAPPRARGGDINTLGREVQANRPGASNNRDDIAPRKLVQRDLRN